MNEFAWLISRLTVYRSLGFFSQFSDLSDMALIQKLSTIQDELGRNWMRDIFKYVSEENYETMSRQIPYYDFDNEWNLLRIDNQRVWSGNTECDGSCKGLYASRLQEWARTSRQVFSPTMISEQQVDNDEWIDIGFTHGAVQHHVRAKNDGWLNPNVLPQINRVIAKSGFQFCYSLVDHDLCIVMLTETERNKLATALSWKFDSGGYCEPKNELKIDMEE
jgi:hypothetical protein